MIQIDTSLTTEALRGDIDRVFEVSARKIAALEKHWDPRRGAPVFTVDGRYTSRGWTEWTQGFQYGSAILQFAATGDRRALEVGRQGTRNHMAQYVSHGGVHDHGFNSVSTYGGLWLLAKSGRISAGEDEIRFYELALMVSGAVQARAGPNYPGTWGTFIPSMAPIRFSPTPSARCAFWPSHTSWATC